MPPQAQLLWSSRVADDAPKILLVEPEPAQAESLVAALQPEPVLAVRDAQAAFEVLARGQIHLVLCATALPDRTGLSLLQRCAASYPECARILLADYSEVPQIVRARAAGVVHHVLPRSADAQVLKKLVHEVLGEALELSVTRAPPRPVAGGPAQGLELLLWTVEQLARVRGVVVRALPPDPRVLLLQFVLPRAELGLFQARMAKGWPPPVDTRWPIAWFRRHPVARLLGLSASCVLYATRVEQGHVFTACLPWRREARVTVVLGFCCDRPHEALRPQVEELHRFALQRVREFPIPSLPADDEATGVGQPVLEYDWIVTDTYAGPDRRGQETSFLNRFVFFGRRARVPSRLRQLSYPFVDRLPARVWRSVAAYLALSALDTYWTFRFVRDGTVQEMNPLLRPLVLEHPGLFFAAKNFLALLGIFAIARFHLFRPGAHLLRATLAGYLVLDLYWLWLLLT